MIDATFVLSGLALICQIVAMRLGVGRNALHQSQTELLRSFQKRPMRGIARSLQWIGFILSIAAMASCVHSL